MSVVIVEEKVSSMTMKSESAGPELIQPHHHRASVLSNPKSGPCPVGSDCCMSRLIDPEESAKTTRGFCSSS